MGKDLSFIEHRLSEHQTWSEWNSGKVELVKDIGFVRMVDCSFGSEFDKRLWVVLEVDGRTFRKEGYSVSHDGWYWDGDFFEVKPVERVVKAWDPV